MTQVSLFENRYVPARSSDPVTSALAAEEVAASGERERQCREVLMDVQQWPGATSYELAREAFFASRIGASWVNEAEQIRLHYRNSRRLSELRDRGLVHNGPDDRSPDFIRSKRRCRVSGKMALVWWPT